jgi:hypothetical protein
VPRHVCHIPYIDACSCSCLQIRWDMVTEAVPAFLTIAVMPLTYSIAYGECASLQEVNLEQFTCISDVPLAGIPSARTATRSHG